jgi:lysophospholipase L1-like esterase
VSLPAIALAVSVSCVTQPGPVPFELKDGDRIVWIGNTLVEREQRYGYWETALYAANPGKNFTLRNLGWSGDTVWGESRAGFDTPAKGFERLVSLTLELKPTVIFVCYGTNESFEGEAGLPRFEQGLNKLLDALKPANARVVLFTPMRAEANPSLPDPAARNRDLLLYEKAIEKAATARSYSLVHLFAADHSPASGPLTENGIHLTETGYRKTASDLLLLLGMNFGALDWAKLDPLRKAVVEKNQLFFYRWRPQNETYLFGFRKHEQGKNAKEVAEFDPLVAKAEVEIAKLRKELK